MTAAPVPAGPTGAQIASGLSAIIPWLAKVQALMATPQFAAAAMVAEDIEQALAYADVPGAAIAEQITAGIVSIGPGALADAQIAIPILSEWMSFSGAFDAAPSPDPVSPVDPTQFSRGR